MTLFLAHTRTFSTPTRCYSSLPRLQLRSPSFISSARFPGTWKPVRHRNVLIQSCAVTLDNGGFDDAGDGVGFFSPPSPVLNSGASTIADSSGSRSKEEELLISLIESRIERVWLYGRRLFMLILWFSFRTKLGLRATRDQNLESLCGRVGSFAAWIIIV